MAVSANLFVTDSLVGSTQVKNTFANISVGTRPLAFIGDQSFVVRLRRNSTEGDVIATTPQITIRDNAALVSFVANTYTVAEGDLVEFTLTTTGAPNNAVLFYSTLGNTPNVDVQDFVGANTGSFVLVNNVGTIVLRANTDGSVVDETGETFKLQIRTGSVTGNVVLVSDNVAILDTSNISSYFISQTATSVLEGSSVTFVISTVNVPNNYVLYYRTLGNVISTNFVQGNTGSVAVVNNAANITLTANAILAQGEERVFVFQILEGAVDGDVVLVSNTITVTPAPSYLEATGGTVIDDGGYRLHVFTTSADFTVNSLTGDAEKDTINYLVVAGGGGSGAWHNGSHEPNNYDTRRGSGGGGAGGLLTGNLLLSSSQIYNVVIGGGGAGGVRYLLPPFNMGTGSPGGQGANSSILGLISYGGGGGACHNPSILHQPITNQALAAYGVPGGSGGGAGATWPPTATPSAALGGGGGTPGQGNPGGNHPPARIPGTSAGGGGAGAAGGTVDANPSGFSTAGSGGAGKAIPWVPPAYGTSGPAPGRWFAGGGVGGGSQRNPSFTQVFGVALAGAGGGGRGRWARHPLGVAGQPINNSVGESGNVNTGGGAGGSGDYVVGGGSPIVPGGAGGSGIVIVRYPYQ